MFKFGYDVTGRSPRVAGVCSPRTRWAQGARFWLGRDGREGWEGFLGKEELGVGCNRPLWESVPVTEFESMLDEGEGAVGTLERDNCEGTIPGENAMRKLRAITATVSRYFWRVTTLDITSGTLGPVY